MDVVMEKSILKHYFKLNKSFPANVVEETKILEIKINAVCISKHFSKNTHFMSL